MQGIIGWLTILYALVSGDHLYAVCGAVLLLAEAVLQFKDKYKP